MSQGVCLSFDVNMSVCDEWATLLNTPREVVPWQSAVLPQDSPAQVKQHVVKALLLSAFGGQLQDLGVAVKQLAGVAGCSCRLHLISSQNPHFYAGFVERLNGVCCFFLESVVKESEKTDKERGKIQFPISNPCLMITNTFVLLPSDSLCRDLQY